MSWAGRGRLPFGDVPGEVFELLPLIDSEKNTDRHYKRRSSGSGDAVCVGFDSLATGVPLFSFVVLSVLGAQWSLCRWHHTHSPWMRRQGSRGGWELLEGV